MNAVRSVISKENLKKLTYVNDNSWRSRYNIGYIDPCEGISTAGAMHGLTLGTGCAQLKFEYHRSPS